MIFEIFVRLYDDASDYENLDMYIMERGWQDWMGEYGVDQLITVLSTIYDLAKANLREMREMLGWTRAELSRQYGIPVRTLEDWEAEINIPAFHTEALYAFAIFTGLIEGKEDGDDSGETN